MISCKDLTDLELYGEPPFYDNDNYYKGVAMTQLCYRCGKNETAKIIDGVPVCVDCMLRDAKANRGRVPDYSALTPIGLQKVVKAGTKR